MHKYKKKRFYKTKEGTRSPTVTTESMFLSCVIVAEDNMNVATFDLPGESIQEDMDYMIHV